MKNQIARRTISLALALICVMGLLPLSALAVTPLSTAPGTITQVSTDYITVDGRSLRYSSADATVNAVGRPYVFNEQVDSFYWRDTIPAEVRLDSVVTGTYNFPGSYKIV